MCLVSLTVFFDSSFVYGLEPSWSVVFCQDGACSMPKTVSKKYVSPSPHSSNLKSETIDLHSRNIKNISIRAGNVVDFIEISLSDGSSFSFGNPEGGSPAVSFSGHVLSFHGGFGGHLHSVGVYTLEEVRDVKKDLKTLTKDLFSKFVSEDKLSPNEAAVKALQEAKKIIESSSGN